MSRKVLGLEIGEDYLAAVLLDSGFKGSQLEHQGIFAIPADKEGDEGLEDALKRVAETIKPAACQVVPEVNWSRSSKTTSSQPISARW